jgi:hypothetical protein
MLRKFSIGSCGLYLFVVMSTMVQADVLDFLRPEEERQSSRQQKNLGLGFTEYETKSGRKRSHWDPLASFNAPRSDESSYRDEYDYDDYGYDEDYDHHHDKHHRHR